MLLHRIKYRLRAFTESEQKLENMTLVFGTSRVARLPSAEHELLDSKSFGCRLWNNFRVHLLDPAGSAGFPGASQAYRDVRSEQPVTLLPKLLPLPRKSVARA